MPSGVAVNGTVPEILPSSLILPPRLEAAISDDRAMDDRCAVPAMLAGIGEIEREGVQRRTALGKLADTESTAMAVGEKLKLVSDALNGRVQSMRAMASFWPGAVTGGSNEVKCQFGLHRMRPAQRREKIQVGDFQRAMAGEVGAFHVDVAGKIRFAIGIAEGGQQRRKGDGLQLAAGEGQMRRIDMGAALAAGHVVTENDRRPARSCSQSPHRQRALPHIGGKRDTAGCVHAH